MNKCKLITEGKSESICGKDMCCNFCESPCDKKCDKDSKTCGYLSDTNETTDGAIVNKSVDTFLFTKSGIADLLVCYKGYFIAIELKAKDGKPSALQIYNKKLVERAGGISIILYPEYFNKLKEFLKSLKQLDHTIYLDLEGIPV